MDLDCDVIILGAGAIGLSVGAKLAARGLSVILIEKYAKFGQETSSRNSEVIHSGIYYPKQSLKTQWCIAGRDLLYSFCRVNDIPHLAVGKIVVATNTEEEAFLENMALHCQDQAVPFERWDQKRIYEEEESLKVKSGLFFPLTGIVDSHQFMACLERKLLDKDGVVSYRHQWMGSEKKSDHWKTRVKAGDETFDIRSQYVINAAGLSAAKITNQTFKIKKYQHKLCQGRYLTYSKSIEFPFRHLVYPVPQKDGLGVHITLDLTGQMRFGPDVNWLPDDFSETDPKLYDCDWEPLKDRFIGAIQRYFPGIQKEFLNPGLVGVRPKLFIDGIAHPDFYIEEKDHFVSCLGMESPGLTSALAIANEVSQKLGEQ